MIGRVPARYVRHSQMCPQLDVSDKTDEKRKICPTKLDMSDKNEKTRNMSDRARYARYKLFGFFLRFPEKRTPECT